MRSKIIAPGKKEKVKEPNSWDKFNNWMLLSSILKASTYMGELQLLFKQLQALKMK